MTNFAQGKWVVQASWNFFKLSYNFYFFGGIWLDRSSHVELETTWLSDIFADETIIGWAEDGLPSSSSRDKTRNKGLNLKFKGICRRPWWINLACNKGLGTKKQMLQVESWSNWFFFKKLINILDSQMDLNYNLKIKYARNGHWESRKLNLHKMVINHNLS